MANHSNTPIFAPIEPMLSCATNCRFCAAFDWVRDRFPFAKRGTIYALSSEQNRNGGRCLYGAPFPTLYRIGRNLACRESELEKWYAEVIQVNVERPHKDQARKPPGSV